ncbi:MAG: maleylpyruvate isomerase N-terminal domain-containing protein [Mycobacterium leprae]
MDERDLPDVLRRQWERIAVATSSLDLSAPSRVAGWRNAEVIAHLAAQLVLLCRVLRDSRTGTGATPATVSLEDNLAGTRALAEVVDAAAKRGAHAGEVDVAGQVAAVSGALAAADVAATVVTLQGPIRLGDYLRTRCVEAVVHGMDVRPPIAPDPAALAVTVMPPPVLCRSRSSSTWPLAALPPPARSRP